MKLPQAVMLLAGEPWRIALRGPELKVIEVALPEAPASKMIAEVVAKALKGIGYSGQPLVMALPSQWCLAAAIDTSDLPRKGRSQAMVYRLEEQLPMAAEEFVADFVSQARSAKPTVAPADGPESDSSGQHLSFKSAEAAGRLGIAVSAEHVVTLVQELESHGVAIGPICPESLLALQGFVRSGKLPSSADATVLWAVRGHLEAFNIRSGVLESWNILEQDPAAIERYLSLHRLQAPADCPCILLNIPEPLQGTCSGAVAAESTMPTEYWAAEAAGDILSGTLMPLVNLRRGALASSDRFHMVRQPLKALKAAILILMLCLIGALLLQGHLYSGETAAIEARQEVIYRRLYPGSPVPVVIRARLQSEAIRLRAVNGQSTDLPRQGSALLVLYEVLRRLPTGMRYRFLDLRFGPKDFALEGLAKDHSDADVIAAALRRQKGFAVDPARTEHLPTKDVLFSLAGTADQKATQEAGR